ncbi:MAG: hypothetical protein CVV03_07040, partial [Firmicutes bacterium HGW-Firmicutes-8]
MSKRDGLFFLGKIRGRTGPACSSGRHVSAGRSGLGILTGFPLAVWQSKLPPAGRNAMSQNLMAQ